MSEWISVKVRMPTPEEGREFLVWDGTAREKAWFEENEFSYDRELSQGYEKQITHWQPLPEPPVQEGSRWILVEDLMPTIGQDVLLKVHYKHTPDLVEARYVAIGRALGSTPDSPWFLTHPDLVTGKVRNFGIVEIVAWQPLPN